MPQFEHFPFPCRYNTLRLLGHDYHSLDRLCAITLVTDLRCPVFADVRLAKSVLASLLSEKTLIHMSVRAFTLMPNHLHFIAGVRHTELGLSDVIGRFKCFTTQLYWRRSRQIVSGGTVELPSSCVRKSALGESAPLLSALIEGGATLRPEVVRLERWPKVKPEHFRRKHLWQTGFFDHVIRNSQDLDENLTYIAMNPVRAGYVSHPCFYPYTGFLRDADSSRT